MKVTVNKGHAMHIMIQIPLTPLCKQIPLSVLGKKKESFRSTEISARIIPFLR